MENIKTFIEKLDFSTIVVNNNNEVFNTFNHIIFHRVLTGDYCEFHSIDGSFILSYNEVKKLAKNGEITYRNGFKFKTISIKKFGSQVNNKGQVTTTKQKVVGFELDHISSTFKYSDEQLYNIAKDDSSAVILDNPKDFFLLLNTGSISIETMRWFLINID